MSVFADSSAIVKLYSDEAGHDEVRALTAIAIAEIARVEVPAALWRKHRLGELDAEEARVLTAEFEADYFGTEDDEPRFAVVGTTADVLDHAATLCATHGLRAYDAVQLSTALAARIADPHCSEIAAFDRSLRGAASAEGFDVVPAKLPTTSAGARRRR